MNKTKRLILLSTIAWLAACNQADRRAASQAVPTAVVSEAASAARPTDLTYIVEAGDTLSLIARKTTGDGENWREIVRYNNIKNPDRLEVDDVILIPSHLLPPSAIVASTPAPELVPTESTSVETEDVAVATLDTEAITDRQEINEITDGPNDTASLPPILEPVATGNNEEPPDDNSLPHTNSWVMIEGSYYPKAIYLKPDYSGGLLTRILPGTTLRHLGTDAQWYEVETEKGPGYVHISDARLMSSSEISSNTKTAF